MNNYKLEEMEINFSELRDWSDGARRALDREREKMVERVELVNCWKMEVRRQTSVTDAWREPLKTVRRISGATAHMRWCTACAVTTTTRKT